MKSLPIGVKFFSVFGIILALVVVVTSLAWRDVRSVRDSVADLRQGPLLAVETSTAAQRAFLQLRLMQAERKDFDQRLYVERLDSVRRNLDSFVKLSPDLTLRTHAERAGRLLVEWDLLARNGDRDHRLDNLTELIRSDLDADVKGAWDGSKDAVAQIEPGISVAAALIAALGLCTIILGLIAGLLVNNILRPLAIAAGHARRIASGDLDKVIAVENRHDEPGQLLIALETMRSALKGQQVALERLATTDVLTGLPNRRRLEEACQMHLARTRRQKEKLSVVMIDVDKFKAVNDTHGHQVGDQILQHVAQILGEAVRESDFVGRWGGEEFMVLCPNTKLADAGVVAEKLRAAVAAHEFPVVGQKTASFGVAELGGNELLEDAVRRADNALYQAKENGRNRVEMAA